jgi:hypothetical protein
MFILDFFLAAFALAPFGLLVLFWKEFHEDRGVHPIYRDSTTEVTKKAELQDIEPTTSFFRMKKVGICTRDARPRQLTQAQTTKRT